MTDAPVKPSTQPPAIGYICVDDADEQAIAGFVKEIAACCLREGLRLTRTLADRGYDGTQLARLGIAELQELLKATPGLTVVVPTLDHFSPSTLMADTPETYGRHSHAHAHGLSVAELLRRLVARGEAIRLAWRGDAATSLAEPSNEFPTAVLPVIRDDTLSLEDQETEPTAATRAARQRLGTDRFSWWPKPLAAKHRGRLCSAICCHETRSLHACT